MPARGRGWEVQLELLHARYRRDRLALVWRQSQPVKHIRTLPAGQFVAAYASDGPPDFGGFLQGGRGVALDAKDVQGTRFPLAQLERHQAVDLEAAHDRGAFSFVALRLQGDAYALPWNELGPLWWAWQQGIGRAGKGEASLRPAAWWLPFDVDREGWLPCVRPPVVGAAREAA